MASETRERLPDDFIENLTPKQEAFLRILLAEDGDWIRGVDIRQRMRDEYNLDVPYDPGAINGLMAAWTRKYSRQFRHNLMPGEWIDNNHVRFRIGEKYKAELEDRLT